jgi:hypothetical protein
LPSCLIAGILDKGEEAMKKTTIYIDDEDFGLLKAKSFIENCSIAELIRKGIKAVCREKTPDKKLLLKYLKEIHDKNSHIPLKQVMKLVDETRKEARKRR